MRSTVYSEIVFRRWESEFVEKHLVHIGGIVLVRMDDEKVQTIALAVLDARVEFDDFGTRSKDEAVFHEMGLRELLF